MADIDLLVVEDHPLFRSGMQHMAAHLRPAWRMRFVTTAAEALAALDTALPSAIIIDIGLPDENGVALTRTIASRAPDLPVLLISARDQPAVAALAERSGARGFVAKGETPEEIARAIDTVLAGGRRFARTEGDGAVPVLTARQSEVLALLDEGCSNKEMRYRLGIAERTVRAHLTEIFTLLHVHNRMQALIRARELGLLL